MAHIKAHLKKKRKKIGTDRNLFSQIYVFGTFVCCKRVESQNVRWNTIPYNLALIQQPAARVIRAIWLFRSSLLKQPDNTIRRANRIPPRRNCLDSSFVDSSRRLEGNRKLTVLRCTRVCRRATEAGQCLSTKLQWRTVEADGRQCARMSQRWIVAGWIAPRVFARDARATVRRIPCYRGEEVGCELSHQAT